MILDSILNVFWTMLNIAVTENKVAASTSPNTSHKVVNLKIGVLATQCRSTLNCCCRGPAGASSTAAVLHCWAEPEEPALKFPDVLLQCPSRYPEQSNATPGELPGCGEIGDLCTVLVMWWVWWVFMVHETSGAMMPCPLRQVAARVIIWDLLD